MNQLDFDHLKRTWDRLGLLCPFFSVLTQPKYHRALMTEKSIQDFYATGQDHIVLVQSLLLEHGATLVGKRVLDFGCGVGRMTKAAIEIGADTVCGVDISDRHLSIAKQYVPTAQFVLIDMPDTLPVRVATKVDIVYSFLVFQHIRPLLMMSYLYVLLHTLDTKGVAVLHIPHEIHNQEIPYDNVRMFAEIHALPEYAILNCFEECDCVILQIDRSHDLCGEGVENAIYVVQKM
jgi:SAM-dependent methyltransferase